MNNLLFNSVTEIEQILIVESMAKEIWNEYYCNILSKNQISYMLNKFQSCNAISSSINYDNYKYYIISYDNHFCGYIAIHQEDSKLFLSKFYILKEFRNKGIGKETFKFLKSFCVSQGLHSIYLTVNKYNFSSISIYKSIGFKTIDSVISDIGNDYIMDDYIMELIF